MKKTVFFIFIIILVMSMFFSAGILSDAEKLSVNARAAYVIEADSGTVIYEQNSKDKHPVASIVKIMTSLIAFEQIEKGNMSLNEVINISENASGMGGSQMFLDTGDNYTVSDLIKGIVVVSANDASVAIAERIAGSEEEFVNMMNKRAKELNMNNTHFSNCTGLPAPSNYSSAEDVAKMTLELIKHKDYYRYSTIWIENFNHPDGRITEFVNTNKLIRFYKGCDGGKTGYTSEALFCLSASAERNGMRVISVILGSPSSKIRFAECSKLLNTAFALYENKLVVDKDNFGKDCVNVPNGKSDNLKIALERSVYVLVKKGEKITYDTRIEIKDKVTAPISRGDRVGTLYVIDKGVVINEIPIIATENIDEAGFYDYLRKVLTKW